MPILAYYLGAAVTKKSTISDKLAINLGKMALDTVIMWQLMAKQHQLTEAVFVSRRVI
ncbi:hypothetical protein TUM3792_35840 [Shewanella sp. MBTL60-007]|nr:hypothetical protein TUM3792_35840 [Shewanella sp. MBTL60-007]